MQEISVQELPEMPELQEVHEVLTLELVGQHFKEWRSRKKNRDRIPMELWRQAVDLTAQYSISEVCKNLGLGFGDLKKHVLANREISKALGCDPSKESGENFLEIKLDGTNSTAAFPHLSMLGCMPDSVRSSCLMELSKSDGSMLKVYSSIGIGEQMERIDINRICETFLKN